MSCQRMALLAALIASLTMLMSGAGLQSIISQTHPFPLQSSIDIGHGRPTTTAPRTPC